MDREVLGAVRAFYHQPVLCETAVQALVTDPEGVYVDATFGGGGHSRAILEHLGPTGRLFALDRDPEAPLEAIQDRRFHPIRGNFRDIETLLGARGVSCVTGVLADLGLSSHQVDTPERGFSYRFEAPLDLRMNPQEGLPAWAWLAEQKEESLAHLLRAYGDLPQARKLARAIQLSWRPGFTTGDLVQAVQKTYGPHAHRYKAQVFQALRIALNGELEALQALLAWCTQAVNPGGRLVVLTYHSGEARLVKALYQQPTQENFCTGHKTYTWQKIAVYRPSVEEVRSNPRSRSAQLWVLQKL
ncbi:MAG: 16S rRNA (cytosine(1402)-N(4))-methyltransferase RsmH [Bacteroidetes bacterium]|nr:MAG: 16S rRNA (cytosine(1402)-N(4))-methyltransferase RsmH [Bacteroidota bacterium]